MDKHTERRHYLNTPVTARYVRFHPVSWHRKIGLRAGVIGCRYNGNCGAGFMQVNSGSSCSKYSYKLGLFGTLKLALVLQFIVMNSYFSVT